ncbi:hypothetical protein CEXT_599051 [Caerostris extrusa]|uniref:Uncharacterized protein n=1 Tax=Caerostris extrusa TaxID=172846 RepID=A0AAV4N567_CAEEX|nr:hypothetical protein CEXT_599051 [Caerostris extrusa]
MDCYYERHLLLFKNTIFKRHDNKPEIGHHNLPRRTGQVKLDDYTIELDGKTCSKNSSVYDYVLKHLICYSDSQESVIKPRLKLSDLAASNQGHVVSLPLQVITRLGSMLW